MKALKSGFIPQFRMQTGDTLIEVVIALAILSFVLTSSMAVASSAIMLGQTAKNIVIVADAAQEQMEELRGFYDNVTWGEFINGSSDGPYSGVLSSRGTNGCHTTAYFTSPPECFHMEVGNTGGSSLEYVPADGPEAEAVPTSYVEIVATPNNPTNPTSVTIMIDFGFDNPDGIPHVSHIKTLLVDLQSGTSAASAAPSPGGSALIGDVPCAPSDPTCSGTPPANGSYDWTDELENLSPTGQDVVGCTWDWGDGTTSSNTACDPGDQIQHTFVSSSFPPLSAYPGDCEQFPDTITLTENLANGLNPSNTYQDDLPTCD